MQELKGRIMPERRCILTMTSKQTDEMIRLVMDPEGKLVADVAAKLPGRGIWVSADGVSLRDAIESGRLCKAASRSLKTAVPRGAASSDLLDQMIKLLTKRCLDRIGLEQKAGNLVTGFDKINAAMTKKGSGTPSLIVAAMDGADDGRRKIRSVVGVDVPVVDLFDREQLSIALGRDNVVHVLLFKSGGTDILKADIGRLTGLTPIDHAHEAH
jgi:predicted RNA-binding protein YlxR (DUF448 family)